MSTLYPWLVPLWQRWQPALQRDGFAQAILLSAQAGLGTGSLIELLAKTCLCKSGDTEPCGFCHSCDLFDAGTHPDFHILKPVETGKSISVDQVRQCQQWTQKSSQLSGRRVIWIENADSMTESAANALLKSLEEPTETCSYILSVEQTNQLLPTIISRCQQWKVTIPNHIEAVNWLNKQGYQSNVNLALRLANGSPLMAVDFINDKKPAFYHKLESAFIIGVEGQAIYAWGDVNKLIAEDYSASLDWLWYLLTDAQKLQFGITVNTDDGQVLQGAQRLSQRIEPQKLHLQTNQLVALIKQFHHHSGLNRELLTLNWLMAF
ncbi:DNA polymerase III subunit delta' [Vibrio sp. FNV 38]|nr:DNA polymerase III subunit delta' [Vibrio sp. FNV 38]